MQVGTPRWRRIPEDRTRAILNAALTEFDLKGLSGAKMDDIAVAGGLSKGSIYRYFPDKNTLFAATVQSTFEEFLGWGVGGPPRDRQLFLRRLLTLTRDKRFIAAYRLSLTRDAGLTTIADNRAAMVEKGLVRPFADLLAQTEGASTLPQDAPLIRARLAISTLLGAALTGSNTPETMDAGVAFLLRACELEAQSPQADGF